MAYFNVQTSNDDDNSKRQVSSVVLVSISFVVFCGIIFYHVWDHLMKSHLKQAITKVQKMFKKPLPLSNSNDMTLPLMHSRSPGDESKSISISIVSVQMRRESLLFDENN